VNFMQKLQDGFTGGHVETRWTLPDESRPTRQSRQSLTQTLVKDDQFRSDSQATDQGFRYPRFSRLAIA
jgi:hypothetical protein